MKINRFHFAIAKAWLEHGGKKGLKRRPRFLDNTKFLDVACDDSGIDSHCYDVILSSAPTRLGITILDIHGGAYVYSTRRHNHTFLNFFLEKGFDVVSLDYPLNDGKRDCLDQLNVLWKQISHFAEHIKEYGVGEKIYIMGDSAGGHFALALAEALCDEGVRQQFNWPKIPLALAGVLVNCPVYDFKGIGQQTAMTDYVADHLVGPRRKDESYLDLVSPKTHIASLRIPLFLSSCKQDFLSAQSFMLREEVLGLGHELEYVFLDTDAKGVSHVHNVVNLSLPESIEINEKMAAFMASH